MPSWSNLVSTTVTRVGGQTLHDCFVRELEKSSMYGIGENNSSSLSSTSHGFVYMRKNHIKCKWSHIIFPPLISNPPCKLMVAGGLSSISILIRRSTVLLFGRLMWSTLPGAWQGSPPSKADWCPDTFPLLMLSRSQLDRGIAADFRMATKNTLLLHKMSDPSKAKQPSPARWHKSSR